MCIHSVLPFLSRIHSSKALSLSHSTTNFLNSSILPFAGCKSAAHPSWWQEVATPPTAAFSLGQRKPLDTFTPEPQASLISSRKAANSFKFSTISNEGIFSMLFCLAVEDVRNSSKVKYLKGSIVQIGISVLFR